MALVKCSECGNDVSDQAAACPKCGAPVARAPSPTPSRGDADEFEALRPKRGKKLFMVVGIAGLALVAAVVAVATSGGKSKAKQSTVRTPMNICSKLHSDGIVTTCVAVKPHFEDINSTGTVNFQVKFAEQIAYQGELAAFDSLTEMERYMEKRRTEHFRMLKEAEAEGYTPGKVDRAANEPLFYKSTSEKILGVLLPGPASLKAGDKSDEVRRAVER